MITRKIIFIVGPTAVGKTSVSVLLAKRLKTKIISCDSMQIYKEISILSGKPSKKILNSVPHYLINCVSINQDFNAAAFRRRAIRAINRIHQEGKVPVITGGTGLYITVLLDGIFKDKGKDDEYRKRLQREIERKGTSAVYQRLKRIDPEAAGKIHPHDARRIIRALEIYKTHKKRISKIQKERKGLWGAYDIRIMALTRDRQDLYHRINDRVEHMFRVGAVQEVKRLLKKKWGKTAQSILGVREIQRCLKDDVPVETAKDLIKQNTRRFAKRQLTWFRRDKRLEWIFINKEEQPLETVARILEKIKQD